MMVASKQWWRIPVFWVALCSLGMAQTDVTTLLKRGLSDAVLKQMPLSETEKNEVLAATAWMLKKKISFFPDGSAGSVHHLPGDGGTRIEWKDFKITGIVEEAVTQADRANSISKRYRVRFGCAASRVWAPKTNGWSEWKPNGDLLFPSSAKVEELAGKWVATVDEQGQFLPVNRGILPSGTGGSDLPAGMMRGKK